MQLKSRIHILAMCLVLLSMFFIEEVESRRVILMGRKTITRTYYKKPLIPAWATVTLVGVFMLVLGGGVYFLLNKIILGDVRTRPKFSKNPVISISPRNITKKVSLGGRFGLGWAVRDRMEELYM